MSMLSGEEMMKKSDFLTPFGLFFGAFMILIAIYSNGNITDVLSFLDLSSFFIVFGGVMAALFISFPLKDLKLFFKVVKQSFSYKQYDLNELIQIFIRLSEKARREGLLALEAEVENVDDPFIRKGILLAVDGLEPDVINDIMSAEISAMEDRHHKGRKILERAGEYSPAWGMVGTLIGLILMLKDLNDPESLGPNMAIALITTLYGVILANLIFLPMSSKLALKTEREVFYKQVIIEGVIGVQSGQNPRLLEEKLRAFLSDEERNKAMDEEHEEAV